PAILWTGLAMSFGVTSVFPILATGLGGHQSARTLHFVCVVLLLFFVAVHILMIYLAGFWRSVTAMITGYMPEGGKARLAKFSDAVHLLRQDWQRQRAPRDLALPFTWPTVTV